MASSSIADRTGGALVAAVVIELTCITAWIHLTLGGTIFFLNAVGYAALAVVYAFAVFTPIRAVQRRSWLAGIGLALYSLVTISLYLATGPYFNLGWIAKGIEVAIVCLIGADLLANGIHRGVPIGRQVQTDGLVAAEPTDDRIVEHRGMRGLAGAGVVAFVVVLLGTLAVWRITSGAGVGVGPVPGGVEITMASRDNRFTSDALAVPAGRGFMLRLNNEDSVPHNVAIYRDSSASESLFVGELITGDAINYEVPALEAGTYYFRCDLHPEMDGTLTAEPMPGQQDAPGQVSRSNARR